MKHLFLGALLVYLGACSDGSKLEGIGATASANVNGSPNVSVLHESVAANEVFMRAIEMTVIGHDWQVQSVFSSAAVSSAEVFGKQKWRDELMRLKATGAERQARLTLFQVAFTKAALGTCDPNCMLDPVMTEWKSGQDRVVLLGSQCFAFLVESQRYLVCASYLTVKGAGGEDKELTEAHILGAPRLTGRYVTALNIDTASLVLWWGDRFYFSRAPEGDLAAAALLGDAIDWEQLTASTPIFKLPLRAEIQTRVLERLTRDQRVFSGLQGPEGAPFAWQRLYSAEPRCVAESPRVLIRQIQSQSQEVVVADKMDGAGSIVEVLVRAPALGTAATYFKGREACLKHLAEAQTKLRKYN